MTVGGTTDCQQKCRHLTIYPQRSICSSGRCIRNPWGRGAGGVGGGDHGPKQWPAAWKRLRSSASAAPSGVRSPGSPSPPCPARRGTLTRGGGSKKSGRLKPIRSTPDLTLMPPPPPQGGVPEPTHPLALFPQASSQLKRSLRRTWVDCFFFIKKRNRRPKNRQRYLTKRVQQFTPKQSGGLSTKIVCCVLK